MQTFDSILNHCRVCRLRPNECVCLVAPRLRISTRLIVIMHCKEWRRSTNTGHLARLAIQGAEVRLHGLPQQTVSADGIDSMAKSTLVLFPGRGAPTLNVHYLKNVPQPVTLLVPDGNWIQTKNMMRRVPMLRDAQSVSLEGPVHDVDRFRHNQRADCMSTFESIAQALGVIEGGATEDLLMRLFRLVLASGIKNSRRTKTS